MPGRFDVVTGIKRSGTSAMMLAAIECGIPACGFQFPVLVSSADGVHDGCIVDGPRVEELKRANPLGYWECSTIVSEGLQLKHKSYHGAIVKVLLTPLIKSNADMINRVVMMIRHPKVVFKSRQTCGDFDSELQMRLQFLTYTNNYVFACSMLRKWGKPFIIVDYNSLVRSPESEMIRVCSFLERGQPDFAHLAIDKTLNHSSPIEISGKEVDMAVELYEAMKIKDYDHIFSYNLEEIRKSYNMLYNLIQKEQEGKCRKESSRLDKESLSSEEKQVSGQVKAAV